MLGTTHLWKESNVRFFVVAVGLLGGSLIAEAFQNPEPVDRTVHRVEYEDQEVRVLRLLLAPHQRTEERQHPDRVVVFLTADWQGRFPTSPVEWQPGGRDAEVNSSSERFEAILVELKGSEAQGLLPAPRTYLGVAQIQLINNQRVEVRRMVVGPGATAPNPGCHIHGKAEVFVHLAAASVSGVTGGSQPVRVTRGQVTVVAPGQKHFFQESTETLADFIDIHPQGDRSIPQSDCR